MENWLIRVVALFCGAGAAGLLWTFGVFVVVPWRAGRLLSLNGAEWQILAASLLLGLFSAWGTLHILAMAERSGHPRRYAFIRAVWALACMGAMAGGVAWSLARLP